MGCTTSVPVTLNEKIEPMPEPIVLEKNVDEISNASNDSNSIQINLKDMKSQTKILKSFNKNIKNSNNDVDMVKNVINTYDEHVYNLVKDEESELGYFIDNYILLMKYLKKRDKLETQFNFVITHPIIELKKNKVKIGMEILDNRINKTTRKVLKRKIKFGAKECLDYWFYRVEKKIDLFLETDDDEIIISMYSKVLSKLIEILSNIYSIINIYEQRDFYNIIVPNIFKKLKDEILKNVDIYHILYVEQLKLDIELVDQQIKNFIKIIKKEI